MMTLGRTIGARLRGGECIELVGDVGAGKTTLTKGVALGLHITEDVQSPSFTISREYDEARDGLHLAHYDFYRLMDPGIMTHELAEALRDPLLISIIEWADSVEGVLPDRKIVVRIQYLAEDDSRRVQIDVPTGYEYLVEGL